MENSIFTHYEVGRRQKKILAPGVLQRVGKRSFAKPFAVAQTLRQRPALSRPRAQPQFRFALNRSQPWIVQRHLGPHPLRDCFCPQMPGGQRKRILCETRGEFHRAAQTRFDAALILEPSEPAIICEHRGSHPGRLLRRQIGRLERLPQHAISRPAPDRSPDNRRSKGGGGVRCSPLSGAWR